MSGDPDDLDDIEQFVRERLSDADWDEYCRLCDARDAERVKDGGGGSYQETLRGGQRSNMLESTAGEERQYRRSIAAEDADLYGRRLNFLRKIPMPLRLS